MDPVPALPQTRRAQLNWFYISIVFLALFELLFLMFFIIATGIWGGSTFGAQSVLGRKIVELSARSDGLDKAWSNALIHGIISVMGWVATGANSLYVLICGPYWANLLGWMLPPTVRVNMTACLILGVMLIALNVSSSVLWAYSTKNDWK